MPEYPEHEQAKRRIRDIARRKGLISENEIPFWCYSGYHDRVTCYSADIFIMSLDGTKEYIVEIDGYKGHSIEYKHRHPSSFKAKRDKNRTEDIQALWGDNILVRRYTIQELEILTDEEIEKDLGIE